MGGTNVRSLKEMKFVAERKKRPRSHWEAYQKGLRKAELAFVSELRHEANRRANYRLELQNIDSMLAHMYRPQLRPTLEARKATLTTAIRESLGK